MKQEKEKVRKIKFIFALIMMLTGVGIFSYPFISNALANRHASVAVQEIDQEIKTLEKEQIDAMKEAAKSYNSQLNQIEQRNAEGEGVVTSGYMSLIQLGEAMGYISIPKIDVSLPIYEGTGDDVLSHGIGHLTQTSYPLGGPGTHSALSGHRGLAEAELFTNLDKLEPGDLFYLHILDEVLAYQVDQILVVEPDDISPLGVVDGQDLCTLVTCTPIGINSHRLLVRGKRTEYTGDETVASDQIYQSVHTGTAARRLIVIWPWLSLAALISIGLEAFLMLVLLKRMQRDKEDD